MQIMGQYCEVGNIPILSEWCRENEANIGTFVIRRWRMLLSYDGMHPKKKF